VGKVHLSEIISSVDYTVGKVHLSEIISSVELYRFNIGGGLCSEWEKYTSVKLYLVLSYTVLI
jgi:hypothetical protein